MTETRITNPNTGGAKGSKLARYDLVPAEALHQDALLYGIGVTKYGDNNWRKGYNYSLSYAAMMRHAQAWWAGQDHDPETGTNHLVNVRWHAATLLVNSANVDAQLLPSELDDRPPKVDLESLTAAVTGRSQLVG